MHKPTMKKTYIQEPRTKNQEPRTNSSGFVDRYKYKLTNVLKNTSIYLAFFTLAAGVSLGGCGLFPSDPTPTPPPVSYHFSIPTKNGLPSVVTSYAVANDLYGSPTILPYLNNTTGLQDIISVTRSPGNQSLMYWQNDGLGGYVSSILASNVFNQAWSIMGANINNDNILDVIVQDSTAIHFVKMNANHTAPIINTWTVGTGFTAPNFVLPVDVNNDGSIDLVSVEKNHPSPVTVVPTANGISGYTVRIRLYLNDGVGNFMAQPLITCSERNGTPTIQYITGRPAAGNLDADPYPELVIGSFASPTTHTPSPVFVLDNVTGTLDGSCTALNEHGAIPGRLHPSGVSIKDMNGDQKMDVVVGNFKGASVAIFPGNGTLNGLLASTPINLSSAGSAINGIEVADLNNDGNPDIVAANADPISPSVELFFNKGGMSFVNQSLVADIARTPTSALTRIQYNHGTSPMDVRVRDVNGDNKPDIITANFNPTAVNPATPTSSFSVILQK